MNKKRILILRSVLFIFIFFAFISLEAVAGFRLIKITIAMILLLLLPVLRINKFILPINKVFSFIIDIILILIIALSSRYVINYYVYALYMMVMVEAGLLYDLKYSKYVIGVINIVILYHHGVLYYYRRNLGTLSEIFFLVLINVLIILGVVFVKYQREEKIKQNKLYLELENTHEKLLESNKKISSLTKIEIKNNLARDIHDSFGHDMMALIMEIEMANILIDTDKIKAKKMLKRANDSARMGMKTIRKVVETLRDENESIITETISEMIDSFVRRTGLKSEIIIDKEIYNYPKTVQNILYRIIQESLTNSVRHGEATFIKVVLNKKENKIFFNIFDNGKGCKNIKEGFGLKGMRERISLLNGKLMFKNEEGFIIEGFVEVKND